MMTHRLDHFDFALGRCASAVVGLGFDLSLMKRISAGCIVTCSANREEEYIKIKRL